MHLIDSLTKLIWSSEETCYLHHVPVAGDRRHPQDLGDEELSRAMLRVLVQKLIEHGPGLQAVLFEKALFLFSQPVGPLAPGAERGVVGYVTEQVKGIGLGPVGGRGQLFEADPPFLKQAYRVGPERRICPSSP